MKSTELRDAMELCGPIPTDQGERALYAQNVAAILDEDFDKVQNAVDAVYRSRFPSDSTSYTPYVEFVEKPPAPVHVTQKSDRNGSTLPLAFGLAAGASIFSLIGK